MVPAALNLPASHEVHSVEPGVATVPVSQGAHVVFAGAPVRFENVSTGHGAHAALPAGSCANVPPGHGAQTCEPLRTAAPAVDVPRGHAEQLLRWLAPAAAENVPPGHARHCPGLAAPGVSE